VVDKFVLVESDRTHSNESKPFFFENNRDRYNDFLDKIIHIKLTSYPKVETSWTLENYQRNMITEGLKNCKPDDIIIISDIDEIPNPDTINDFRIGKFDHDAIFKLQMAICCYFINYKNIFPKYWHGSRITVYENLTKNRIENYSYIYDDKLIKSLNDGCTPTKIRMASNLPVIKNGGWHFTYLGGLEQIKYKIRSFGHQEFNNTNYLNDDDIKKKLEKGIDFFNPKEYRFIPVKIKAPFFPEYLAQNQENYSGIIYHDINSLRNAIVLIKTFGYYYVWRFPAKKIRNFLRRLKNL
jgi:beta-1,4-mannosyl-glycoprotein beta-1,4-N-acetylglucosaminyltransferase